VASTVYKTLFVLFIFDVQLLTWFSKCDYITGIPKLCAAALYCAVKFQKCAAKFRNLDIYCKKIKGYFYRHSCAFTSVLRVTNTPVAGVHTFIALF
jgi:hypothetical protein